MKTFIAMISLFTLITVQAASISTVQVSKIETRIEQQREDLSEKTAYPVGNKRVVAVTVFQIEALLEKAKNMLDLVVADKGLTENEIAEKIKDIDSFLVVSANLIYQLPY